MHWTKYKLGMLVKLGRRFLVPLSTANRGKDVNDDIKKIGIRVIGSWKKANFVGFS